MKVNYIIIKYDIIIKKSSTVLTVKRIHFRLHALKLLSDIFQSITLSYVKRKWDWKRIKENLFIFNLSSFKMFMKILKILNITLF